MSRNFELLQELGRAQSLLHEPVEEPVVVPSPLLAGTPSPLPGASSLGSPALQIDGMAREEVVKLVQRLFLVSGAQLPRQVVFAGTERGNGCSWICAHVAEILASQVASSVCVVDCDVHAPTLHREFQVQNHYGLADALREGGSIRQYVQVLSRPNLCLLSCGAIDDKSPQTVSLERMHQRLTELRAEFDYVLLDAAPLNCSNLAMLLGSWCEGMVLVLKANSSNRNAARKLVQELQAAKTNVLGAVLNQRTFPIPESIYRKL